MSNKRSKLKIILSAIIFIAARILCSPVSEGLNRLVGTSMDWTIPFRLAAMVSGLVVLSELCRLVMHKMNPLSSRGKTVYTLTGSALRYIFGIVGLLWALAITGVNVQALLAGAGVAALIIGFGAESLIADIITGVFMIFENQYEVGDIIVVGDFRGTVTQIGIRTTSITDSGGNVQIINNSDIRNLINRSSDTSYSVCDIAIPYTGYLLKAEAVLKTALPKLLQEHPDVFLSEPQYLGVQTIHGDIDAVTLRISAEVSEKDIYIGQRLLNRSLLLEFEAADIPNPVSALKIVKE